MLCETRVARQLLAADEIRRVEEGVGLAECLLAAWRIGRGRPVDRAILETSDAISETFIEPMVALAAECGGRADRLMAALEGDRRPKRFRAEKCEELRVHLIEAGCLDERAPLDAEGLWVRTLRDLSRRMQELAVGGSEGREAGDDGGGGADGSPLELARLRRTFDALLAAIGEPPLRDGASKESE
jgi:hypothetical protein